jgi:hypothetical protein
MINLIKSIGGIFLISGLLSCNKPRNEEIIPLSTSVRLQTMHHNIPVAEVNVFIKYNTVAFPGFDKPAVYFDTMLVSDKSGKVAISPVLQGSHWAVAFGSSEHGVSLPIYGSMPFFIDLEKHPTTDTLIYMFE